MPTAIDRRRLRDGEKASAVPPNDLAKLTLSQLQSLRETVFDGALAMQSRDDLGSPEANDAAWEECIALDKKLTIIDKEIKKRKAT